MASAKGSVKYLDGWILKTSRGNYYYGILPPAKLERLLRRQGYDIETLWVSGQLACVLARRAYGG